MSDDLGKLAEALAKAQAEFEPIIKSLTVKFNATTYKYADLAAVIAATTPALSKHGLAVTQCAEFMDGHFVMHTKLIHVGGGSISSIWPMPSSGKPQDMGSWASYARRYSLSGILNVASEVDDDGQTAKDIKAEITRLETPKPEAPKPSGKTIFLDTGSGSGSEHASVGGWLDALEAIIQDLDDAEMVFDLNEAKLQQIQAKALKEKNDAVVERIAQIFNNIQQKVA